MDTSVIYSPLSPPSPDDTFLWERLSSIIHFQDWKEISFHYHFLWFLSSFSTIEVYLFVKKNNSLRIYQFLFWPIDFILTNIPFSISEISYNLLKDRIFRQHFLLPYLLYNLCKQAYYFNHWIVYIFHISLIFFALVGTYYLFLPSEEKVNENWINLRPIVYSLTV